MAPWAAGLRLRGSVQRGRDAAAGGEFYLAHLLLVFLGRNPRPLLRNSFAIEFSSPLNLRSFGSKSLAPVP